MPSSMKSGSSFNRHLHSGLRVCPALIGTRTIVRPPHQRSVRRGSAMKIAEQGPDLASLQELVDSVPALIHTARPDGAIDFFNHRWLAFVGLRLEDLEGWKWTEAVHPDDVEALGAKWRARPSRGAGRPPAIIAPAAGAPHPLRVP